MMLEIEINDHVDEPQEIHVEVTSPKSTGEVVRAILDSLHEPAFDGPPAAYVRHKDYTLVAWTWKLGEDDRPNLFTATWSH